MGGVGRNELNAPAVTVEQLQTTVGLLMQERDDLKRKLNRLEHQLYWTRQFHRGLKHTVDDLIDRMALRLAEAGADVLDAEAERERKGDG